MIGALRTFRAAYSANLRSVTRFVTIPGYLGYSIAGPFFALLTSWVIASRVIKNVSYFQSLTGSNSYLTWVVIGFAFQSFIFSAAFGGAQAIRGEQQAGTAELVFITPANKVAWLLGKMAADQTFSLLGFAILLMLGGTLFGLTLGPTPNVPLAALGIGLTMLSLSAFGMVFAGITFIAKREDQLSQVLWPIMVFFCGLAFPIEALPAIVQPISWVFPLTYGLYITRTALLTPVAAAGAATAAPSITWLVSTLSFETLILIPIGIPLFNYLSKNARKTGALGTY